ncbi:hypothetical protein Bca52824_041138 [Brassica carinata]|uniref:Uncharacterized protein n=1 Tax=Brassica carinata TaxID=52824 RepID=A0A8X7RSM1_BRACI|nr:hypothetical protein Bca52824_041138 [Brassica carinata]
MGSNPEITSLKKSNALCPLDVSSSFSSRRTLISSDGNKLKSWSSSVTTVLPSPSAKFMKMAEQRRGLPLGQNLEHPGTDQRRAPPENRLDISSQHGERMDQKPYQHGPLPLDPRRRRLRSHPLHGHDRDAEPRSPQEVRERRVVRSQQPDPQRSVHADVSLPASEAVLPLGASLQVGALRVAELSVVLW